MPKNHYYTTQLNWMGNLGEGTKNYRVYTRDYEIKGLDKISLIPGSSDPSFRGDRTRYNPEELLLASLSTCHMLWYLHFCSVNDVVVTEYQDEAKGVMIEKEDGSGQFKEVTLHPRVRVSNSGMRQRAMELHAQAHQFCFIANSVNFPVCHQPEILSI